MDIESRRRVCVLSEGRVDWQPYLDIDLTRIFETQGRSITMATGLNLDQVEFLDDGNEV